MNTRKKYGSAGAMLARLPVGSLLVKLPQARRAFDLKEEDVEQLIRGTLLYCRNPIKGGRGVWCVAAESVVEFLVNRSGSDGTPQCCEGLLAGFATSGREADDPGSAVPPAGEQHSAVPPPKHA